MQQHLDSNYVSKTYWPERLELVSSLPRTPSGKIQKYLLRARLDEIVQEKAVPT
jgi:cyclohexanecarboxylate-CoA ligase